jgi:hypothetical protein
VARHHQCDVCTQNGSCNPKKSAGGDRGEAERSRPKGFRTCKGTSSRRVRQRMRRTSASTFDAGDRQITAAEELDTEIIGYCGGWALPGPTLNTSLLVIQIFSNT